ncbi:MAG: thiol-disulfide oxidoreductase DCC family protein [Anaerolineae bacterium]|nr:thiol-disulfide oxidoreductase DCC family protein [Anaerolineae bacterium]
MLILLYDGVCGLCNWSVQFIIRHDAAGQFHFAALQSELAQQLMRQHGLTPNENAAPESVVLIANGQAYTHSAAAFEVMRRLGQPYRALAVLRVLPRPLTDWAYRLVARYRYRLFGRSEACMLPPPAVRARFLG